MSALRVSGISKRYGRLRALDEVSFEIRAGEVLGLIGPNGSGKTTLFECLAGVMPADGGRLLRDGVAIDARDRASRLFYLPDAIVPWPSQSVGWMLDYTNGLFARADGARSTRFATREDAIARLDLAPFIGATIQSLSKGQRKRALLAMALLMPHALLLLDEPFDGLDLRQSRDVARVVREQAAVGRTMFLSIHQISEAARVCDRFVLLSNGRVRGEGGLDDLMALASQAGERPARDLEEVFLALT